MTGSKNECCEQIQRMILPLYTNFGRWTNSLPKFTAKVTANFTHLVLTNFQHGEREGEGEGENERVNREKCMDG